MLNIHPSAINAFNKKADSYGSLIKTLEDSQDDSQNFHPDFHPIFNINSENLNWGLSRSLDIYNNTVSIYLDKSKNIGIFEEDYTQIKKFLVSLSEKHIGNKISFHKLECIFQEWAIKRFIFRDCTEFISYLSQEYKHLVKTHEMWIPIEFLSIEREFKIGKVLFKPILKNTIDDIKIKSLNQVTHEEDRKPIELFIENKIRLVQGYTAAIISVEAEFHSGCKIATEEVKRSLSILRLFSVSMYQPRTFHPAVIWGSSHADYANILSLENGSMVCFTAHPIDHSVQSENLSCEDIDLFFQSGLGVLDEILRNSNPNDFQVKLLNCVMLLSRSTIAKEPSDKVMYILTALETFFLKNSSEPIQQNLGERIAFLVKHSPDERQDVVKLTRKIYDLRSKFIHHGEQLNEYETLKKFMRISTDTIITLIDCTHHFSTVKELLEELDQKKFS